MNTQSMNAQVVVVDEFGREPSLRKNKDVIVVDFMSYFEKYRNMSWAEIEYAAEEEEEEEERTQIQEKVEQRRKLFMEGNYELEEGEILE
jgi:hypothetical protein